ncbi:MAG: hypothetical protein Q9208_006411 [Pyrenodesmia sp. 3 TL-2023]
MTLPLPLPTPSPLSYPTYITSPTHPSLPVTASTHHSILRSRLKTHLKLPISQQPSHLPQILTGLTDYLPYLFALRHGLEEKKVGGEEVDVVLRTEVVGEWGSMFADSHVLGLGRMGKGKGKNGRFKGQGIDFEVCMVLSTLAVVLRLQARERLRGVYGVGGTAVVPMAEERAKGITSAMRLLLQVVGVHAYLREEVCGSLAGGLGEGNGDGEKGARPPETGAQVQGGLQELAMAEATLLAVLKDDPYPAVVAQERNRNDKEWMIKAPEIPKVRAHLCARLCIAAAEHAGRAEAMLRTQDEASGRKVEDYVVGYAADVRRTARARACRFFGIDDELGGDTGKAIAWLRGAKTELGFKAGEEGKKGWVKGLGKLKKGFDEKGEDKRLEKGGEWGGEGGKIEEGRVIEMLEKKWVKVNDTINTQLVPPYEPLLAGMPSGREIHSSKPYVPPELDADILEKMRAPPDPDEARALMDDGGDSSDDDVPAENGLPGAFPNRPASGPAGTEYY